MGLLEIICGFYPLQCIKNYLSISKSLSCTSSYTLGIYLVKIILKVFFIFEDFPPLSPNIITTSRRRERRSIKMVLGDLGPNLELWGINRRFAATWWRFRPRGPDRPEPWRLYEYEYEPLHQSQVSFYLRSNIFSGLTCISSRSSPFISPTTS